MVPPFPIPNREVKRFCTDNSCSAKSYENRSWPELRNQPFDKPRALEEFDRPTCRRAGCKLNNPPEMGDFFVLKSTMGVRGTIHLLESAIVPFGGSVAKAIEDRIVVLEGGDEDSLLWMVGTLPNMRKAKVAIGCNSNGVHAVSTFIVSDGHGGKLVVEGIKHK